MAAVKGKTTIKTLDVLGKVLNFWAKSQPGVSVYVRLILPSLLSGYLLETLVSYIECQATEEDFRDSQPSVFPLTHLAFP